MGWMEMIIHGWLNVSDVDVVVMEGVRVNSVKADVVLLKEIVNHETLLL